MFARRHTIQIYVYFTLLLIGVVLCVFIVLWSLPLAVSTIVSNPASDVVAVFTHDSHCEFLDIQYCRACILIVFIKSY